MSQVENTVTMMAQQQLQQQAYTLVVGLGVTGLSVVRYLYQLGEHVIVVDNKQQPSGKKVLDEQFPDVEFIAGEFVPELFINARRIVVSPGVPLAQPVFQQAREHNVEITGDINLFAHEVTAPVAGITGSNGKSTVTVLLTTMAEMAGVNVAMGGNIGTPALDLLTDHKELYVLELSSFQLEILQHLPMKAAVVLNISSDHMDRYQDLNSYALSKLAIYNNAQTLVVNRDDALVMRSLPAAKNSIGFTLGEPQPDDFGVRMISGRAWLCFGEQKIIEADSLKIKGQHNIANALAALAMGRSLGLSMDSMCEALQTFGGLPHRTQWVAEIEGVNWYNDSKATNVGAAQAAIEGLPGQHILLAGGDGKDADFSPLRAAVAQHCRAVVLFGRDADKIENALNKAVPVYHVDSMHSAVMQARQLAQPGDNVLLSPACASYDMFNNFEHRGEVFMQCVGALLS